MPKLISREHAKRLGLKRYFTGKPCKSGHVAERFTFSNGKCVTCAADRTKARRASQWLESPAAKRARERLKQAGELK